MLKNIFFDLDGTIIDSSQGIINAYKYALKYFNIEINDDSTLKKLIGPPLNEAFAKEYGMSSDNVKTAIMKYREYYSTKGIEENKLYNGILELFEKKAKAHQA